MGVSMGYAIAAAVVSEQPVVAIEDERVRLQRCMEIETICRLLCGELGADRAIDYTSQRLKETARE
jgi:hypothetical protein